MKRKELKLKVKSELKELAREIREMKNQRKKVPFGYVEGLEYASEDFRRKHIAYCIFFNGTPYERIESNPRDALTTYSYGHHIDRWKKEAGNDKTLCSNS